MVIVTAIVAGVCLSVLGVTGEMARPDHLITGLDTNALLKALGQARPTTVVLGKGRVTYILSPREGAGLVRLGVAVCASEGEAAGEYAEFVAGAAGPVLSGAPPEVGNQFATWVTDDGPGTMLLRRENVLLVMDWKGARDKGVSFARRVDEVLVHDDQVCPKGVSVPVPEVELIGPPRVVLGAQFEAVYRSLHTMLIRTEAKPILHLEGTIDVTPKDLGPYTVTLTAASSRNVVFTKSTTVLVVRPEELPTQEVTPWDWPGRRLYFVRGPDQPWAALPFEEREWIEVGRSTFAPLKDERQWRLTALAEMASYVQTGWLPAEDMIRVFEDHAHPALEKAYYVTFKRQGYGVIYMGGLGKGFWLYMEAPGTSGGTGGPQLSAEQVLLTNVLLEKQSLEGGETVYPRAEFAVRNLHRYRSLKEQGPFEAVRILLAHVRFASDVNLKLPGYR